ncbi:MAG: hypothetical protein WCI63_03000 [bacterium]
MNWEELKSKPLFIPRVSDYNFNYYAGTIPAILMNANTVAQKSKVVVVAKEKSDIFIIDPITHALDYPIAAAKPTFRSLPYGTINLSRVASDPTYRLNELINASILWQRDSCSDVIIAPYILISDLNSSLSLNSTILAETILNMKHEKIARPLIAMICVNSHFLCDIKSVDYIIDRYLDEKVIKEVDSFIITSDGLDDRSSDEDTLRGLAYLVYRLSQEKNVFVNSIGGFGEALLAIGATGFISKLAEGEVFSTKNLEKEIKGSVGRNHHELTYVPEFCDYLNVQTLKKIGYSCSCIGCNNTSLDVPKRKKIHFLVQRIERTALLAKVPAKNRVEYMINFYDKSIKDIKSLRSSKALLMNYQHIQKWKNILEDSQNWGVIDDQEELESIYTELKALKR